jgi:hypothetical protein
MPWLDSYARSAYRRQNPKKTPHEKAVDDAFDRMEKDGTLDDKKTPEPRNPTGTPEEHE